MLLLSILLGQASLALAWPNMGLGEFQYLQARDIPLSENEHNSGPFDSLVFDADEQFVNVTAGSSNEFRSPGSTDLRGPCPCLNAAANHGFLPRSGIATIDQSEHDTRVPSNNTG